MAHQHVKDFHGKIDTASAPEVAVSLERTAIGSESSMIQEKSADFGEICTNADEDRSLIQSSEQIYIYGNTDTKTDQSETDSYQDICPNANLYSKMQFKDEKRACSIEEKIEENIEEMIKTSNECGKSLDIDTCKDTRTSIRENTDTSLVCKEVNQICVGSGADILEMDSTTMERKCEVNTSDSISANANLYVKESFVGVGKEVNAGEEKIDENLECWKEDGVEWNMESKIDNLERMIKHIHFYIKDCFLEDSAEKVKTSVDEKSVVREESLCEQVTESNVLCNDNLRLKENYLLEEEVKCKSKDEEYAISEESVLSETTVVCEETIISTDSCTGTTTFVQEEEKIVDCNRSAELLEKDSYRCSEETEKEQSVSECKMTEVITEENEIEMENKKTFVRQTSQQAFYKYKACKELMDKFCSSEENEKEEEIVKEVLSTLLKRTEMKVKSEVTNDISEKYIEESMVETKEEVQKVTPYNERQPEISERNFIPVISIDPIKEPDTEEVICIDPVKELEEFKEEEKRIISENTIYNECQSEISERKTDFIPVISIDPIKEPDTKEVICIDPIIELPEIKEEVEIVSENTSDNDVNRVQSFCKNDSCWICKELFGNYCKDVITNAVVSTESKEEIYSTESKEETYTTIDTCKEDLQTNERVDVKIDYSLECKEETYSTTETLSCNKEVAVACESVQDCKEETYSTTETLSCNKEVAVACESVQDNTPGDFSLEVKDTLVEKIEIESNVTCIESVQDNTPGDFSLEVKDTLVEKVEIESNVTCIESETVIEKDIKEEKVSDRVTFEDFSCPICQERFSLCDKKEEIATKELEIKENILVKEDSYKCVDIIESTEKIEEDSYKCVDIIESTEKIEEDSYKCVDIIESTEKIEEDSYKCVDIIESTEKIETAESCIQSWASRDSLNEDYCKSNAASGDSMNEEVCITTDQVTEKESVIDMSQNSNVTTNDFSVNIEEVKVTTDLDAGIRKAIDDVLDMRKFFCKPSCPICREIFKDKTADGKEVSVDDVSISTTEIDVDSMNSTKVEVDSTYTSTVDNVSISSTNKLCTTLEKVDEVNEGELCNDMLKEEIREIKEQLDENKAKIDCLREIVTKANEVEMKYEAETETRVECESEVKIESENTVVGSYEDLSCSICKDRFSDVNQSEKSEDQCDAPCPPLDGCGIERIIPSAPIEEGQNVSECLNTDTNENAADNEEPKKETKKKWRIRFVRSTISKDKKEEKESKAQEEEEKKTEKEKSNKIRFVIEPADSSDDETKKNSTKIMVGDDEPKTKDKKSREELELKNVKHAKIYKEKNAKVEIVPKKSKDMEEAVKTPIRPNSVSLTFDDSIWKVRYVPIGAESEEERIWRMQFEPHCLPDTDKGLKMHFVPVNADEKNPLRMRFVANEDLNFEEGWEIHFAPPELPDDDSSWVIRFSAKGFMDDFILVIYGRKMDVEKIWKDIPFGERCAIAKAQTGVTPTWGAVYRCK